MTHDIEHTITHQPEEDRFVLEAEDERGELTYQVLDDGALDLRHTYIPEDLRGRGLGEELVLAALDHAEREGVSIVPTCPFVGRVLERHPERRDLVR